MLRTALLLACLVTLVACDASMTPTTPSRDPVVTGDRLNRQGIRGVLRRVADDPEHEWQLELRTGEMLRLLGGPLETYEALVDREVYIVGQYNESGITVETVEEDSRIYPEYSRVPAKK